MKSDFKGLAITAITDINAEISALPRSTNEANRRAGLVLGRLADKVAPNQTLAQALARIRARHADVSMAAATPPRLLSDNAPKYVTGPVRGRGAGANVNFASQLTPGS